MKYRDLNGFECMLSFEKGEITLASRHVIVLASFKEKWLLTEHPLRGLEFPGGKVEPGETLTEAAIREVFEETGAVLGQLKWLAEYKVAADPPFKKTVFIGQVDRLKEAPPSETRGRVLMEQLTLDDKFSFLMKDRGMKELIRMATFEHEKARQKPGSP